MTRRVPMAAVTAVLFSLTVQAQEHRLPTHRVTTVENYVQHVFFETDTSGSMIFWGSCQHTHQGKIVYSDEIADPPQGPFMDIDRAMVALSARDAHVSWKRDGDGFVRVTDDRVSGDVLRVRLKRIRFTAVADSTAAVEQVMSAPEVRDYLKRKHIDGVVLRTTFITPGTVLPKWSADLGDVTVAQALDRIIKFFGGAWFYGECSCGSSRRVTVRAG